MIESGLTNSLNKYRGQYIGMYTNDGSYIEGTLYDVKGDFITIKNSDDEMLYLNLNLILAVSKNTKEFSTNAQQVEDTVEESNLMKLIQKHEYSWITVTCHNQLYFSGILSTASDDHIILTENNKQLIIQAAHILDFFPGERKMDQEANEEQDQEKESTNEKQQNDSKESNEKQKESSKEDGDKKKSENKKQDKSEKHSKDDQKSKDNLEENNKKENKETKKEVASDSKKEHSNETERNETETDKKVVSQEEVESRRQEKNNKKDALFTLFEMMSSNFKGTN